MLSSVLHMDATKSKKRRRVGRHHPSHDKTSAYIEYYRVTWHKRGSDNENGHRKEYQQQLQCNRVTVGECASWRVNLAHCRWAE